MALTYQAIYDIIFPTASNPGQNAVQHPIVRQIIIAITDIAFSITNEASTVPNHDNRMAWARAVLQSPQQSAQKFLLAALHTPAVQNMPDLKAVPDAAVLTLISGYVDRLNS